MSSCIETEQKLLQKFYPEGPSQLVLHAVLHTQTRTHGYTDTHTSAHIHCYADFFFFPHTVPPYWSKYSL